MILNSFRVLLALVMTASILGCATPPPATTLTDTLAEVPQFSTFSKLVRDAALSETLREPGPFTVFAPTNEAFKALPLKTQESLSKDKSQLIALMSYHIVQGRLELTDFKEGPVKTVQGASLGLYRAGTFVTVDEAMVTMPNVEVTNGLVHIIDRVLIPPVKK